MANHKKSGNMEQYKIKRGRKYRRGYHDGYERGKAEAYNYTQGYNDGRATGLQTGLKDAYDIIKNTPDKEAALQKIARLQKAAEHEKPHRPLRITL